MKVIEAFKKDQPALSFEFFPPKTAEQEAHLFDVIGELKAFHPDFVSVTYGAMGNTKDKTLEWVKKIKQQFGIDPVAHLTCVNASRAQIMEYLEALRSNGVENILALRGDPPEGCEHFISPDDGFSCARDLVKFIKHEMPQFCIGVAGYPGGHPEFGGKLNDEIAYDKEKVNSGAEYLISQLFYQKNLFIEFHQRALEAGIKAPIIPGIMPIANYKQVSRMVEKTNVTFPKWLKEKLEKHQNDAKSIKEIGIEVAVDQARGLLGYGVKGLHFFVMNQSEPIKTILKELKL